MLLVFIAGETEIQRSSVVCLRSQGKWRSQKLNPSQSDFRAHGLDLYNMLKRKT